ncbi:hypothetical protein [Arenimonas sp.]|uniref:hypothetical protein n=1 Tax=Arenimonas sp. TaxID=1872635 RepID=UPI0025BE01D6|nr:hypothetical protein [Arenimonas sp.]
MKTLLPAASLLASALLLAACAGQQTTPSEASAPAALGLPEPLAPPAIDQAALAPVDAFMAAMASHCGQAFAGKVRVDVPESPDNAFAGKALVMHVRECREGEVKVPFHVGDDRSRTWVLTRTPGGLRLKHDHRHEDGTPDESTMYGGDTAEAGTAVRQAFPVDAESIAMFERLGLTASVVNTWAMEIEPGRQFVYELSRPGGRLFQVEFDLTKPIAPPPAPWGSEAAPD